MFKAVSLSALALVLAAPATAQITFDDSQPASATAAAKKGNSDLDRIVCEKVERLGSRLGAEKVCLTARQWQDRKDGNRHDLEKVQQVVNQSPSG